MLKCRLLLARIDDPEANKEFRVTRYLRKAPTAASSVGVINITNSNRSSHSFAPGTYAVGGFRKRALDFCVALVAIVLLCPILVIVAVAIKIFDGGPVFFSHRRVGFGARPFSCLKFRTMVMDADVRLQTYLRSNPEAAEEWNATRKLRDDPRVTLIGGALRRSSLDELPQLFNVLRGDMSLVGPRPIVADEAKRYGRDVFTYLSVRPGLTGAWQVNGRSDVSYAERVRMDVEYCTTWSSVKDLIIMLRTIPVLFSGRGSY